MGVISEFSNIRRRDIAYDVPFAAVFTVADYWSQNRAMALPVHCLFRLCFGKNSSWLYGIWSLGPSAFSHVLLSLVCSLRLLFLSSRLLHISCLLSLVTGDHLLIFVWLIQHIFRYVAIYWFCCTYTVISRQMGTALPVAPAANARGL